VILSDCFSPSRVTVTLSDRRAEHIGPGADLVAFNLVDAIALHEPGLLGRALAQHAVHHDLAVLLGHFKAEETARLGRGRRLDAGQKAQDLHEPGHGFQIGDVALAAAQGRRGRRIEIERRPAHLVLLEVEFHFVFGDHRVAEQSVQLDARQSHAVHAFNLKRRLDPALYLLLCQAAFQLELVEHGPALGVGLQPNLLADFRRHNQHGTTRIHDEVERALAVDLDAHHDVVRIDQAVRHVDGPIFFPRLVCLRFRLAGPGSRGGGQHQQCKRPASFRHRSNSALWQNRGA
jgi:hypothetical protein